MGAIEDPAGEVVFQLDKLRAWQFVLFVEVDLAGEDSIEFWSVGPLDGKHCVIERLTERSGGDAGNFRPQAILRHNERQRLLLHHWVMRQFRAQVLLQLSDGFFEQVADALEEQKSKNVAAKLRVIDVAAEDVGGGFEERVQLRLRHSAKRNGDGCSFWFRHII